jgi:hypothetical protein
MAVEINDYAIAGQTMVDFGWDPDNCMTGLQYFSGDKNGKKRRRKKR